MPSPMMSLVEYFSFFTGCGIVEASAFGAAGVLLVLEGLA
jgi:hypothetical protein